MNDKRRCPVCGSTMYVTVDGYDNIYRIVDCYCHDCKHEWTERASKEREQ